jgi:hypothetical protein
VTPRTLGIALGAAALVAAASFALGGNKKAESRAAALREKASARSERAREMASTTSGDDTAVEPTEPLLARLHELEPQAIETEEEPPLAEIIKEELKEPTARELHLPVIRAIREDHSSPEARREAMLKALRASGPTSEPWSQRGREVFDGWVAMMPREVEHARLGKTFACYRAGCEMAVRFPSREAAELGATAFRELADGSSALHAGRIQTPPVAVGGGAYESSWILLRPEGS